MPDAGRSASDADDSDAVAVAAVGAAAVAAEEAAAVAAATLTTLTIAALHRWCTEAQHAWAASGCYELRSLLAALCPARWHSDAQRQHAPEADDEELVESVPRACRSQGSVPRPEPPTP